MNDIKRTKIAASMDALICLLNSEKINGLNEHLENTKEYISAKREMYGLNEYGIDTDYSNRTKAWLNRASDNQICKYAYTMFFGQTNESLVINEIRRAHKDRTLLNLNLKIKNPIQVDH